MWVLLFLILIMPLLAWAAVRLVWLFRLRHIDADNDSQPLPDEKRFMRLATVALSLLLLACVPLLYQGYSEARLKHRIMRLPLTDVMRTYRPALYENFVRDFSQTLKREGSDSAALEEIQAQYLHELRLHWQRELPYASLDSVMRYIRYRYNEADVLGNISDNTCRRIDFSESNPAGISASVAFMQRNAGFIRELMGSSFAGADKRYRMNYLEQRGAARQYRHLLAALSHESNAEPLSSIEEGGCALQKAFYLALLDYNEREMSRIMRWVLLQQIAEADRKELSSGK